MGEPGYIAGISDNSHAVLSEHGGWPLFLQRKRLHAAPQRNSYFHTSFTAGLPRYHPMRLSLKNLGVTVVTSAFAFET